MFIGPRSDGGSRNYTGRVDTGVTYRRAEIAEIFHLRWRVLRPFMGQETAQFDGDAAVTTRHYGAFETAERGRCVGCASFMLNAWQGESAWQLRGMATETALQQRGVGAALLRFVEGDIVSAASEHSGLPRLFWCNAREAAV